MPIASPSSSASSFVVSTAAAGDAPSRSTARSSTAYTSAPFELGPMSPRSSNSASRTTSTGASFPTSARRIAATLSGVRVLGGDALRAYHEDRPLFCFTTDIEWAPEWAIAETFTLADRHGVVLVPFVTHRSSMLERKLGPALAGAGIHPNFLPGSTHGADPDAVLATMAAIAPNARAFRSHCFYDDTRTLRKLEQRGFTHDSNACAFLQPELVPMRTVTSILRFPVFWEDDVHSAQRLAWNLDALRPAL